MDELSDTKTWNLCLPAHDPPFFSISCTSHSPAYGYGKSQQRPWRRLRATAGSLIHSTCRQSNTVYTVIYWHTANKHTANLYKTITHSYYNHTNDRMNVFMTVSQLCLWIWIQINEVNNYFHPHQTVWWKSVHFWEFPKISLYWKVSTKHCARYSVLLYPWTCTLLRPCCGSETKEGDKDAAGHFGSKQKINHQKMAEYHLQRKITMAKF